MKPEVAAQHQEHTANSQVGRMLVTQIAARQCKSDHPESNQGPSDVCKFYSQMLYQLSYSRDASLRGAHNCISAASIMRQTSMSACGDGNTGEAASPALVQSTARNRAAHAML
jgi:hypothetical protein